MYPGGIIISSVLRIDIALSTYTSGSDATVLEQLSFIISSYDVEISDALHFMQIKSFNALTHSEFVVDYFAIIVLFSSIITVL